MNRSCGLFLLFLCPALFLPSSVCAEPEASAPGGLDACIVEYVALNEGQPVRMAGAAPLAPAAPEEAASTPWSFAVTPYFWATSFQGDLTIRGIEADVDASFGDLVDLLDMAFCLRAEAWHGPLGFTMDFIYLNLGSDGDVGPLQTDVDLRMAVVELAASWKFEQAIGESAAGNRHLTFEPILGVRYAGLKGELDLDLGPIPGPDLSGTQWWIEPYVGFRSTVEITESLTAALRADIGGFSIGSRRTWVVALGLDYRISELFSVQLGYKWLDIDYSTGSGRNRFELDGMFQGFWLGLSFHF
jgi:hypothetical protein